MLGRLISDLWACIWGEVRNPAKALWHDRQAIEARKAGDLDDAEAHYRQALLYDPNSPILNYNLGLLLLEIGECQQAEKFFLRCLELAPEMQEAHSSLLSIGDYFGHLTREDLLARHLEWGRRFADPLATCRVVPKLANRNGTCLRIGYVSADFRRHVIGRFIEPVLRNHDRSRFRIYCFSNGEIADDMTAHLQQLADEWRNIRGMPDQEIEEQIRRENIDILVDLSGHSAGNRLLVFARKPAKVQMTWMGYLNTTGMKSMDYRITDCNADPLGTDQFYSEKLIRLTQPQWCYVPVAGPIFAPPQPVPLRPIDSFIRFGCVARFMKVSQTAIDAWIRILKELPGSRFRLIDVPRHSRGDALLRRFLDSGLEDRLEVLPSLVADEYWNCLSEIDIALDTFPYTGATTTCDCLWMGIPVVSLAGIRGAERSATSLLCAIGLRELSVGDVDAYVECAVQLARDRPRLAALRANLRDRMISSSICNQVTFTKSIESAYEQAWRNYSGGNLK